MSKKKIIGCILVGIILVAIFTIVGVRISSISEENKVNKINEENKQVGRKTDIYVKDIKGYRYFCYGNTEIKEKERGYWLSSEDYSIFIYGEEDISFNSWDSVVEDCKKSIATTCLQDIEDDYTCQVIENDFGIEICRVSGKLALDGGEGDFVAIFHKSPEGNVRYIFSEGWLDDDEIKDAMGLLAYNLQPEVVIEQE